MERVGRKVTAFGVTKTVAEWAEDSRAGVWAEAILHRLDAGLTPEQAIATPVAKLEDGPPKIFAFGERKTLREWADDYRAQTSYDNLRERLKAGWSPEEAIATPARARVLRRIEAFGETKSSVAWAADERAAAPDWTIRARIDAGWDAEEAITTPPLEGRPRLVTAFGETKDARAWERDPRCEVGYDDLWARIQRGLSPETAITRPNRFTRRAFRAGITGATKVSAWGETLPLNAWLGDRRCAVNGVVLRNRIADGVDPEEAISRPEPSPWAGGITAFGETKSLTAWARDARSTGAVHTLAKRLLSGLSPEVAITKKNRYRPANLDDPNRPKGLSYFSQTVTAFGETKTPDAWARDPRCSVSGDTVRARLKKGMPAELAITNPDSLPDTQVTAFGETKSIARWVRDPRVPVGQHAIRDRLAKGMAPEAALTTPSPPSGLTNLVTAFGESKTLREWADDPRCRCVYSGLVKRIAKGKMTPEESITTPSRAENYRAYDEVEEAFGERKTLDEWLGDARRPVSRGTLKTRLARGWTLEQALTLPEGTILPEKDRRRMIHAFGEIKMLEDWARDPRCKVAKNTVAFRLNRGWDAESALTTPPLRKAVGRGSKRRV